MAPKLQIALDCVDAHAVAKFWSQALGYDIVADPDFVQSMIDQGMASEDDTVVVDGVLSWKGAAAITDPEGVRPRWFFQDVPEPRGDKNRMHVDIHLEPDADRATEVARLEALGATQLYEGGAGPPPLDHHGRPRGQRVLRRRRVLSPKRQVENRRLRLPPTDDRGGPPWPMTPSRTTKT